MGRIRESLIRLPWLLRSVDSELQALTLNQLAEVIDPSKEQAEA
jgi:hypothetical protein